MTTEMNQQEMAGLNGAASVMATGSAESLGQVTGASVNLELVSVAPGETVATTEGDVRLETTFGGIATGSSTFTMTARDAGSLIRSMPQTADLADDELLGEAGMSALAEAMDLLGAGAATHLSNALGDLVDIAPPSVSPSPGQADASATVVVTFAGTIDGQPDFQVQWRFDAALAASLDELWLASQGEPAPVPAESTLPPAPEPVASAPTPAPISTPVPAVGGGVINTVELDVAVELGNVAMTIGELLRMGEGSVVTLTQAVGDKVVMLANGTPVANGEVVVVDGTLGFRVADLVTEAKGA